MILTRFQLDCVGHFQFLSFQSNPNACNLLSSEQQKKKRRARAVNFLPSFYQLETKIGRASTLPEMDRNLGQRDLGKNTANDIPIREADGREKSNKCYQCDSTFSRADNLRTHLKTHSGEKSYKCNQCDYASS